MEVVVPWAPEEGLYQVTRGLWLVAGVSWSLWTSRGEGLSRMIWTRGGGEGRQMVVKGHGSRFKFNGSILDKV